MKKIHDTDQILTGDVVLSGTGYYSVGAIFWNKFRGREWTGTEWGKFRDVPLPSPTQDAFLVQDTDNLMFPPASN